MEVTIMKKLFVTILLTTMFSFSSLAGPTGEKAFDPLINSYLIVSNLAKDGNINAIKSKALIYSFLSIEQLEIVQTFLKIETTGSKYAKLKGDQDTNL